MMKFFAFICLLFVLISCGNNVATSTENQSGSSAGSGIVDVEIPINSEDPQDDFLTENPVVEVSTYSEVEGEKSTSRFALKNDMVFSKEVVDSLVTKCQYFEWETDYVLEEWKKVQLPAFTLKNYFYDAVENGYCPGTESKEEKYTMVDQMINGKLPEKFKNFDNINSLQEVSYESIKIDPNGEGAELGRLALLGIYIAFIEDEDTYNKYMQIYNENVRTIYEDTWVGSEELFYIILMATAYRNGSCKAYIEENLISY